MMEDKAIRELYANVPSVPDTEQLDIFSLVGAGDGLIELEIGFGKGQFILDRAEAHPTTRFLGFETRRKWVYLVAARAEKRQLKNVRVMHGEARGVLHRIAGEGMLAAVFIHFPDPWWKARHEKRMVIGKPIIANIARLLVDEGALFVQTDVDFRAAAYQEILKANPDLVPASSSSDGIIDQNPFGARSLREKRCIETGLPIYRLLFKRCRRLMCTDVLP